MDSFGELLTAMVTPFDDKLELDLEKARELATYLVDNGSDGLVVLGTTGESPTLTYEEKVKLLEAVVDEVGDRAVIVAGTGSYSTAESIRLTKMAEEIGVDGLLLVTPYYNKPPQSGLYYHFKAIAESTSLPIMLYNIPGRTARNIEVETMLELAKIDNIVAVKESSGDLNQVSKLTRLLPDDFLVYSGDDSLTLPVLSVGGMGVVSVAAHLVGKEIKKMITDFKNNNLEEAIRMNKKLGKLFEALFMTTNPIPVKAALNLIGIEVGKVRGPLVEMNEKEKERLTEVLREYELL